MSPGAVMPRWPLQGTRVSNGYQQRVERRGTRPPPPSPHVHGLKQAILLKRKKNLTVILSPTGKE